VLLRNDVFFPDIFCFCFICFLMFLNFNLFSMKTNKKKRNSSRYFIFISTFFFVLFCLLFPHLLFRRLNSLCLSHHPHLTPVFELLFFLFFLVFFFFFVLHTSVSRFLYCDIFFSFIVHVVSDSD
jgi:hypothetical protein